MSVYRAKAEEVVIKSVDNNNHLVFGWANISVNKDGSLPLDWADDVIPTPVLEKAAYNFVLSHRVTGEMHQGGVVGYLIESVMFTKEKMASMGVAEGVVPEGWWVGFYIPDDEVCAKIKSGEYKMFSIQGHYKKVKL
ncbi:hypothetical protein D3C75_232870 [compost metagenome]